MLGDLDSQSEHADAPRRHRRRESSSSLIAMTLVVALFGVLGVGGWWAYNNVIKDFFIAEDYEGDGNGTEVTVEIEQGWFVADIANHLYDEGVIASAKAFTDASEDDGDIGQQIQPGTYVMQEEMSAASALEFLTEPENRLVNAFTVVEGKTSFEIFDELAEFTGLPVEDFEAAAEDPVALGVPEFWFENFETDQQVSIEGFLFPATYEIQEDATAAQILTEMVTKFNEVMDEISFVDTVRNELELEPWMALQVASIIQAESGTPEDDAKIAQVMYNRLYSDGAVAELSCNCLGSEAIWNYGREFEGLDPIPSGDMNGDEMWDADNRWAASVQPGYFPTPIGNPGQAALEGAMSPAEGSWLYFVTAYQDGRALFADTLAEHEDNTDVAEQNGIQ
ncbi:endolytic transglycosylase MltG [Glycomyces salinus]|uniref:endolytic transglycosylase MltG n=1 Tax=Glycomyces salinus TaxID=980294 RepID=UPI0018EB9E0B|nr:endolytic transglycosylase MltG [Glycomyces salinus]